MLKLYISDVDRTVGKLELPMLVEDFKRRLGLLQAEGRPKSLLTIYRADCPVINLSWPLRQVRLDDDSALQKLIRLAEVIDLLTKVKPKIEEMQDYLKAIKRVQQTKPPPLKIFGAGLR